MPSNITLSQDLILHEVIRERGAQDRQWGGNKHDDLHTTAEFVGFIRDFAARAGTAASHCDFQVARHRLIQVAALAIAAAESIDRRTTVEHGPPPNPVIHLNPNPV